MVEFETWYLPHRDNPSFSGHCMLSKEAPWSAWEHQSGMMNEDHEDGM